MTWQVTDFGSMLTLADCSSWQNLIYHKAYLMSTFFAKANPKFPSPKSDGTIETEPFLLAAKQIVPFFGKLGDNREVANKNYSI